MGSFAALQSSVARDSSPDSPASPEVAVAEHEARRRALGLLAAAAATLPRRGEGARGETRRGARATPASGIIGRGRWEWHRA
uniref:Uncharacterized protein n=1 Tax=Arundo donax TaxID=35708 RepID=A0A0A9F3I0_ARUDO